MWPLNSEPPGLLPAMEMLPRTGPRSEVRAREPAWGAVGTCCQGAPELELGSARLGRAVRAGGQRFLKMTSLIHRLKYSQQLRWRWASGKARDWGPLSLKGRKDFHTPPTPYPPLSLPPLLWVTVLSFSATRPSPWLLPAHASWWSMASRVRHQSSDPSSATR